jgi:hypothetical protein
MNRFLLGALAMGAVFVLTSFALDRTAEPAKTGGPAWTVSQYQLDRAFRFTVSATGPVTVPATQGAIITDVRVPLGTGSPFTIDINGSAETFQRIGGWGGPVEGEFHLNPPIVARPGDIVMITPGLLIGGYITLPGAADHPIAALTRPAPTRA